MYTVGQFAYICRVSTKTLRHYDEIGLFRPAELGPENQYRYYSPEQIPLARRIIFLHELGLGLELIRELLRSGTVADLDRLEAILGEHMAGLEAEIARRQDLLRRVQSTVAEWRREGKVPLMAELQIVTKDLPAMAVVGVRKTVPIREVGPLFGEAARKLRSAPAGPPMLLYYDREFDPERADVEVLFPVASGGERTLPPGKVASTLHVGSYDGVSQTYAAVFDWVNRHGCQIPAPCREIYLVGPESGKKPEEWVTEIQVPIK